MLSKKLSIAVIGSTGSVGKTALKILKKNANLFKVDFLCCNKNKNLIVKQINYFCPKHVLVNDNKTFLFIKKKKFKQKIFLYKNLYEFIKKNKKIKFDKSILSISSINGLKYGFAFVKLSRELLIANKETIVCGGYLFLNYARKFNCKITSIDSEHYSLASVINKNNQYLIDKVYLTASGGPFLNKSYNFFKKIDYKKALIHPKWKMGKKISIDSATMSNKVLEMIEAMYLFDLKPNKIKIKIHKESLVHSAVVFRNGLVKLVAHNTSMTIPIQNSLLDNVSDSINKSFFLNKKNFSFSFDEKSLKKFKIINLGHKTIKLGPRACIFFNVINDYLVNLYLKRKIFFYEIPYKLNKIMTNKKLLYFFKKKINKIDDIYKTISYAKSIADKI